MRKSKYIGRVINDLEILDAISETNDAGKRRQYFMTRCTKCLNIEKKDRFTLLKGQSRCRCSYSFEKHNEVPKGRLYRIWCNIKQRCYNTNNPRYRLYGARGIIMCEEWKGSYNSFYSWAMGNGYDDSLSIDRIDVNGNYEPSNCRWATQKEQCNNQRKNRLITYNGKTQTLSEWARELGISRSTLSARINTYGWDVADAFDVK